MTPSLNASLDKSRDTAHEAYLCSLVRNMAQRDAKGEQSLSQLYDLTVRRVAACIARFLTDRELIAELTQDAFFQAWNQAHLFTPERGCVLAWLLIIARSRALDARRRNNAQPVVFNSDVADAMLEMAATVQASGAEAFQANQEQRLLQAAVLKLSPSARHIVALSFFSGLSHSEISEHMQLPLGTIKSTLRRGLVSMASELERIAPGIGMHFGLVQVSPQERGTHFSKNI
jgi:RNA polymerase sigma factor (sigma-70 family)